MSELMGPARTGTVAVRAMCGTAPGGRLGLAKMSAGGGVRWSLGRVWEPAEGIPPRRMTWIMLNSSWANWERDDASVRRCLGYAERERCNSLAIGNLVPLISSDPGLMLTMLPRSGGGAAWWEAENTLSIRAALLDSPGALVCLGWGENGSRPELAPYRELVLNVIAANGLTPHALGVTASGEPVHPLRQRADAPLIPWSPRG